jgi:hypothetical protein
MRDNTATPVPGKWALLVSAMLCSMLYSMQCAAQPGLVFPQGPSDFREMSFSRIDPDIGTLIDSGTVQPATGTETWDASYPNLAGLAVQNSFIHKNADNFNAVLLHGSGSASTGNSVYGTNVQSQYYAIFKPTETFEGTISATLSGGYLLATPSASIALWNTYENSATKFWGTDSTDNINFPPSGEVSYHGTFDAGTIYALVIRATGMSDPYTGAMAGSFVFTFSADVPEVAIDVLPGDTANKVYPNKTGNLPVAILSSADFDATQVDPATLRFGSAEAPIAEAVSIGDLDGLHGDDTLAHFRVQESGIFCNDTEVLLTGETYTGELFAGVDTIDATECESGGCHPY